MYIYMTNLVVHLIMHVIKMAVHMIIHAINVVATNMIGSFLAQNSQLVIVLDPFR